MQHDVWCFNGMPLTRVLRTVAVATCIATSLAMFGACQSGTGVGPTDSTAASAPRIVLSPSRSIVSTPRGWNAIVDITIVRSGVFSDSLDFSLEGTPPKISARFAVASVSSVASGVRLEVDVDSVAAIGEYPLTVRARSKGAVVATTTITVVVPRPTISLTLTSPINSLTPAGRIVQFDAVVFRDNGFRGAVTLDITGALAELNGLRQVVVPPERSRNGVAFLAEANALPGRYLITIRATGADVEPRTAMADLVIPPP